MVGDGGIRHTGGETPAPGLYVLGLPWLHTIGSHLLGLVGRDAERLTGQVEAFLAGR